MANEKDLIEFAMAQRALNRQQMSEEYTPARKPYILEGDRQGVVFVVKNRLNTGRNPGLQYDPYHVGQAMAVRDALNDAYNNGYQRAISSVASGE